MKYQQETLYEIIEEVQALLQLHYEEIALNRQAIKLAPMWEQYAALERMGSFVVYTARDDSGALIGYSAFFISQHMHYAETKMASNDVLFLHPDHRQGSAGLKLIKFSDRELEKLGANKITWHVKIAKDWRTILHRMGYVDEEIVCARLVKGN